MNHESANESEVNVNKEDGRQWQLMTVNSARVR